MAATPIRALLPCLLLLLAAPSAGAQTRPAATAPAPLHQPPYTDQEAQAFAAKLPTLAYPIAEEAACKALGIDRARLGHNGFIKSESSGWYGRSWDRLSPSYWISFHVTLSKPQDLTRITIAPLTTTCQFKQQVLAQVVHSVAENTQFVINREDLPDNQPGSVDSLKVDYTATGVTCQQALDALQKQTHAFTWKQDGTIINITAAGLTKDNPFDAIVPPLTFKGTRHDLVTLLNQKVPSLQASMTTVGMSGDHPEQIGEIATKAPLPLRQVLNEWTRQARQRWSATISPPQPPVAGFIMDNGKQVPITLGPFRTNLIFGPAPHQ